MAAERVNSECRRVEGGEEEEECGGRGMRF